MISTHEVKRIAKLSRLEFSDQELEDIKKDLSSIVGYVNQLQSVDTKKQNFSTPTVDAKTQLRPDEPSRYFTPDEAVQNAAAKRAGAFLVPPVME